MPATPATTPLRLADDLALRQHARALAALIAGEVRVGRHDRLLYATDASLYQVEPLGVVIPANIQDVLAVVRYAGEHGLPLLPRGGGTSLAGQCTNRALVVDFSAGCRRLLRVDAPARRCEVEPGITIDDLNDELRPTGLFFAPDPATSRQCNVGGCIGNNAAGTRSILYGRTAENLLGVSAMLTTGETCQLHEGSARTDPVAGRLAAGVADIVRRHERLIRERFPRTLRRNAGYALDMMLEDIDDAHRRGLSPLDTLNLAHLICGAEGTLAVVTAAELTLHELPRAKGLAVLGFASLDEAIDAVVPLLGLRPSAVELLDDMVVGLARANTEYARYVRLMPQPAGGGELAAVLYVEFFAWQGGATEIEARFADLRALMTRLNPRAAVAAYTGAAEMAQALKLRKAGEPLLHGIPGSRKPLGFVEDNAVPVERLAEFVRRFREIVASTGTKAAFYAHASVGVLHVRPLLDLRDEGDRRRMHEIAREVAELARSLGGVMSGEHGDGRVRGPLLEAFYGRELMDAFREVKALFDPRGLLNPGNVVAPGPLESITETTRIRPTGFDVHGPEVDTFFDYTEEGGFDHAVELCNGSGVCRKKTGGTMCPSYMATLDERHSTRGRGNALRLAITGQSLASGADSPWGDPETLNTLDLCLSCKACKTECPTNVDVSKYKAEYLAQTYREQGTPLKALALGNIRLINQIGSAFAPLSNWAASLPLARWINRRLFGLSPRRSIPRFERPLHGRLPRRPPPTPGSPAVILYADCFTTYNEPRIGLAAERVLSAFGYRVVTPRAACCGRAQISTGLLADARSCGSQAAEHLLAAVAEHRAVAVVACEPSCLASIKDDWLRLRLTVPAERLRTVAAMSFLVEDFLDRRWDEHPSRPDFRPVEDPVALHAHCHQKALWGADTSARLLRRLAGERLRVLDTGCCGMAGSFGYADHRYDLSMTIGELSLFPAIRSMDGRGTVVAPGTSCRHQIHDGLARRALHPIELVDQLIALAGGAF
ncbi:MAG: FAD-binding protein [Phycisphaerales bacterium]|nr:FAD-binding protein [Phycisphaerales bacterium]